MKQFKRVFVIVLDSVGAGEAPDAAAFGDKGAGTLRTVSRSPFFAVPNLKKCGIGNIDGLSFLGKTKVPSCAVARMTERSAGKDTTIGHWEIAGVFSPDPMPTFPEGFPPELIAEMEKVLGRKTLCNIPYSGTDAIRDYGEEHLKTGALITYTSADSVYQIAAHESLVPPEELYDLCRKARKALTGKNAVGRVIARPFVGNTPADFVRTGNRRDFSLEPTGKTMLDAISEDGLDVISVGKISDIFAARGVTEAIPSHNNEEGMEATLKLLEKDFHGLAFTNLVDFDSLYGHRNDAEGYAKALSAFDKWLPAFLSGMGEDDVLFITADHGCDPGDVSTDHTREYTPLLIAGKEIRPVNLGTRGTFADIAATVCRLLGVGFRGTGRSFASKIVR